MEALNIVGMTASAKGTVKEPGRNVAQKAGLNRVIQVSCQGQFERMLSYKMEVIGVPAAYTSQKCSSCGEISKASKKSQSEYKCTYCGYESNAGSNAALNIRAAGLVA